MTNLAHMTYSEWGQHGTAMRENSNRIREWLGHGQVAIAASNLAKYRSRENGVDVEVVGCIAPEAPAADVVSFRQLSRQATVPADLGAFLWFIRLAFRTSTPCVSS